MSCEPVMALEDEGGGNPAATVTKGAVDPREKGKSVAGTSSSAAAGRARSMTTDNNVEVVTQQGKRVKLKIKNGIEDPWSHGDHYGSSGFKCHYCVLAIKSGGASRLGEHLAGIKGQVAACPNVPLSIRALMIDEKAARLSRAKRNKEMRLYVDKRGYGRHQRFGAFKQCKNSS
ncbi:hypothetical protein E2562_028802 [Oryza meyeriana var. granulata]|uniref:BED-type domain-containing protein n=1 Tax=Oryza meyeriana var. granulata TaxID=110450 RepID=A0A6G1EBP5_9ORYZ|nr:hypothetical protein E2562_028802 [Oryza meyeriana var. granulata]